MEEEEADYLEQKPSPEVRIKRPAANTNIIEVRYRGEPFSTIQVDADRTLSYRTKLNRRVPKTAKWC